MKRIGTDSCTRDVFYVSSLTVRVIWSCLRHDWDIFTGSLGLRQPNNAFLETWHNDHIIFHATYLVNHFQEISWQNFQLSWQGHWIGKIWEWYSMRLALCRHRVRSLSTWADLEEWGPPHGKSQKYSFFCLPILVRIPLKSQSYQASIQCWAIKAKCHLNGVSQAGRWWPANSGICLLLPLIKLNLKLKQYCQGWTGPPLAKLSGSSHA